MLERPSGGASVTQIALKCGFQNPGHFARDFRLAFGDSPSEIVKNSGMRRRTEAAPAFLAGETSSRRLMQRNAVAAAIRTCLWTHPWQLTSRRR